MHDLTTDAGRRTHRGVRALRLRGDDGAGRKANLATHPAVARALSTGAVTVEGWVFDIGTGTGTVIDPAGSDRTIAA